MCYPEPTEKGPFVLPYIIASITFIFLIYVTRIVQV